MAVLIRNDSPKCQTDTKFYHLRPGSSVKEAVKNAILELEKHTCIRFVPRKQEKDYIHIVSHGTK